MFAGEDLSSVMLVSSKFRLAISKGHHDFAGESVVGGKLIFFGKIKYIIGVLLLPQAAGSCRLSRGCRVGSGMPVGLDRLVRLQGGGLAPYRQTLATP